MNKEKAQKIFDEVFEKGNDLDFLTSYNTHTLTDDDCVLFTQKVIECYINQAPPLPSEIEEDFKTLFRLFDEVGNKAMDYDDLLGQNILDFENELLGIHTAFSELRRENEELKEVEDVYKQLYPQQEKELEKLQSKSNKIIMVLKSKEWHDSNKITIKKKIISILEE